MTESLPGNNISKRKYSYVRVILQWIEENSDSYLTKSSVKLHHIGEFAAGILLLDKLLLYPLRPLKNYALINLEFIRT